MKSLNGGTYAATQNPAGAVAKANQNAATQPPTVVIQATSSGLPFNYKDDCYVFYPPNGFADSGNARIGMGKLDASNKFTGMLATAKGMGATVLMGKMTGVSAPGSGIQGYDYPGRFHWMGTDASGAWDNSTLGSNYHHFYVIGVTEIAVRSATKCYP